MAETTPSSPPNNCPDCGAPLVPGAKQCWLCRLKAGDVVGAAAKGQVPPPNPYASPAPPPDANLGRTFSLASMFLWTTLVAVLAGLARFAPGLAIGVAVLSIPAGIRTVGIIRRRKTRIGKQLSAMEKIEAFFASLGVMTLVGLASSIAFFATCFPVGLFTFDMRNDSSVFFAIALGIVAAIVVAFLIGKALWRVHD